MAGCNEGHVRFLLTRPLRDVTSRSGTLYHFQAISTHTPLAGRDYIRRKENEENAISTHTPLAGRDRVHMGERLSRNYFYSHAPCGT